MREKYIAKTSRNPYDEDVVNDMYKKQYKLIHIVPIFLGRNCSGYTYWFEDISV